jgi:hypothetical protein
LKGTALLTDMPQALLTTVRMDAWTGLALLVASLKPNLSEIKAMPVYNAARACSRLLPLHIAKGLAQPWLIHEAIAADAATESAPILRTPATARLTVHTKTALILTVELIIISGAA